MFPHTATEKTPPLSPAIPYNRPRPRPLKTFLEALSTTLRCAT